MSSDGVNKRSLAWWADGSAWRCGSIQQRWDATLSTGSTHLVRDAAGVGNSTGQRSRPVAEVVLVHPPVPVLVPSATGELAGRAEDIQEAERTQKCSKPSAGSKFLRRPKKFCSVRVLTRTLLTAWRPGRCLAGGCSAAAKGGEDV